METNLPVVTLRAIEPEDLELLYDIENDVAIWNVSNTTTPYSRFALRNYIIQTQNDIYKDGSLRLIIDVKDRGAVGIVDLTNVSFTDERAEIGIAILEEERQKGYAAAAIRKLEEYCQTVLHLKLVYCSTSEQNRACISLFESLGYKLTAVLPSWYRVGNTRIARHVYQKKFSN